MENTIQPDSLSLNTYLRVEDMNTNSFMQIIERMHTLMKVPSKKLLSFEHCTDRRSLFERAEIESYKHWEYPWALLRSKPQQGMRTLDCGSGRGMLQIYLAILGCESHSVDIRPQYAKLKRTMYNLYTKTGGKRINPAGAIVQLGCRYGVTLHARCEPIQELSHPDNYFDIVYCISVLEHLPPGEDVKALNQMARVTKPGGLLVLTVDFAPQAVERVSYDSESLQKIGSETSFTTVGETDYLIENWDTYLKDVHRIFNVTHSVTTAGMVLKKPE